MFHVVSVMQMEGSLEVTFLAFITFHSSYLEHIEVTRQSRSLDYV